MTETNSTQIAFVCVQNAGRSQMAYAFAQQELDARSRVGDISIVTGGNKARGSRPP